MSPELDELLCQRYPEIFADRHGDMKDTAMCWGFECGDGWFNIIDGLCNNIRNYMEWKGSQIRPVVATQVKEKFGGLRFYYNGGDDVVRGMVHFAESLSEMTCEQCGSPGKLRGGGWLYTRCDAHTNTQDLENTNQESQ